MHREVNLTKRVQTPQGMRYCAVVLSANGRVKPDAVLVNGKPERHPEGAYYIEWHDNGKRSRRLPCKPRTLSSARFGSHARGPRALYRLKPLLPPRVPVPVNHNLIAF
jgi:hypothetical protein